MVFKDWSVKCTGTGVRHKKGRQTKPEMQCPGPGCQATSAYKEKLLAEDAAKSTAGGGGEK